jgi:hypothetical protein
VSQGKVLLPGVGWPSGGQLFGQTFVCLVIESRETYDGIRWWSLQWWMGEGAEFP